MVATQYYRGVQAGSVASQTATTAVTMSKKGQAGLYTIYQGIIAPVGQNVAAAPGHFDVKVGTTLTSLKVEAGLLGTCTNPTLANC